LLVIAGAGAIGATFLPFYVVSTKIDYLDVGYSASFTGNAWYGIFGWLAGVLVAVAAVAAGVHLATKTRAMAGAALALSVIGLVCAGAAGVIYPDVSNLDMVAGQPWFSIEQAYSIGYWVLLVCAFLAVIAGVIMLIHARSIAAPKPVAAPPSMTAPQSVVLPPQVPPAWPVMSPSWPTNY